MKQAFTLLLTMAIVLSAVLASTAMVSAQEEPIEVVYWRALTGVAGDVQDELVQRFNESQSEVYVDVQFQGAYAEVVQKLQAALIAGDPPDLVLLDSPFVALFAKDGILVSLDDFAADPDIGLDMESFYQGLVADGYYQESLYALPMMRSTPLLYYNADMFEAAGLPDRVPETWDEFKEFCDALTIMDGDVPTQQGVSFTMGTTSAHWYFQAAIYAFGGEVSDADFNIYLTDPEAMAAAQLWQDIVFEYGTGKAGIDEGGSHGDFLNHRVGMAFGSTGSMGSLLENADFRLGAGMIPEQERRMVPVGGSVIAMTSNDEERQKAAWEFMKFVVSPESNAYIVENTGYLPTSPAALETETLVEYFEQYPERAIALEQLDYARPQASVISLATGTEILRQAIEKLLVAEVPVEQVMEEATEALLLEYEENFK